MLVGLDYILGGLLGPPAQNRIHLCCEVDVGLGRTLAFWEDESSRQVSHWSMAGNQQSFQSDQPILSGSGEIRDLCLSDLPREGQVGAEGLSGAKLHDPVLSEPHSCIKRPNQMLSTNVDEVLTLLLADETSIRLVPALEIIHGPRGVWGLHRGRGIGVRRKIK